MLMVSTTGEQYGYFELDENLKPQEKDLPVDLRESVARIEENCEPALCTVLFMAGAGGSLRAGVTENPVKLTRSVRDALTRLGHDIEVTGDWANGQVCAVRYDPDSGLIEGAASPRHMSAYAVGR